MIYGSDKIIVSRRQIVYVNFGDKQGKGSLQSGTRPAIVSSNEMCNRYSPVIHVIPLTTQVKKWLPTHVMINHEKLKCESIALVEQETLINKSQILDSIGYIDEETMTRIDEAIIVQRHGVKKNIVDFDKLATLKNTINTFMDLLNLDISRQMHDELISTLNANMSELKKFCEEYNINYKIINKKVIITETNWGEGRVNFG